MARSSKRSLSSSVRSEITKSSYGKNVESFDDFIKRQEGIEGRPIQKGEMLKILTNIVSEIPDYDRRVEEWKKEKRKIESYNEYYKKEGEADKPIPPKPKILSDFPFDVADKLVNFLSLVNAHQSNGGGNPPALVKAFKELPELIKPLLLAPNGLARRLYRGDEGNGESTQDRKVASFASTPNNVTFWGRYVYKGSDMKSFEGIIDSTRIVNVFFNTKLGKIIENYAEDYHQKDTVVGDIEDEKIVFGIKWKPNVGKESWMEDNGRVAETFKDKYDWKKLKKEKD